MRNGWLSLWVIAMGLTGCLGEKVDGNGQTNPGTPVVLQRSLAALVSPQGCDSLLATLKAQAIEQMETMLDQNRETTKQWLKDWGEGFNPCDGDYGWRGGWNSMAPTAGGYEDEASADPSPTSGEGAENYSETNTQVAGVDEADFVKNDASNIYILADGRFQVIDAWPPEQAHLIASYDIEGTPRKMFVADGRAVIYSSLEPLQDPSTVYDPYGYGMYGASSGLDECTYGYECDFTGDGMALKVTVLDLSDPTDLQLVREMHFTGSLVNARRIGDAVYTVVTFPQAAIAGVTYWPAETDEEDCEDDVITESEIDAGFDRLKQENIAIITHSSITDWLPSITDVRYNAGEPVTDSGLLQACEDFYVSQQQDGQAFLSMAAFDMSALGPIAVTTVVGRPGAVYASSDALYVASRHQFESGMPWFFEGDGQQMASTVHKFRLAADPPATQYVGSGVVKGYVINQFAMDEKDGFLRIATSSGHVPDPSTHSTVAVLKESGEGNLTTAGLLDNLAPQEDIRAVRFDGERGFVVTFKKTDPLFVIDLADPYHPAVAGELKIPGFSTYIHMLDDNHLLSIGYDADDQGDFAWFQGIQLQVFDIEDMHNPTLTHRELIGTRGSTSEAATNHLAFNFYRAYDLLGLPMVVCEGGSGGGNFGDMMSFGGLMVYRVTAANGFEYLGGLPHVQPETEDNYWGACGSWWTDSNSYVKRSVFLDDYVFSIAENSIEIAQVDDLLPSNQTVPLSRIELVAQP